MQTPALTMQTALFTHRLLGKAVGACRLSTPTWPHKDGSRAQNPSPPRDREATQPTPGFSFSVGILFKLSVCSFILLKLVCNMTCGPTHYNTHSQSRRSGVLHLQHDGGRGCADHHHMWAGRKACRWRDPCSLWKLVVLCLLSTWVKLAPCSVCASLVCLGGPAPCSGWALLLLVESDSSSGGDDKCNLLDK